MNYFTKYILPGLAVTAVCVTMCNRSADKNEKLDKAGDHLNLFAVMSVFEKSASPEAFEKSINSKSGGVNNLDLNEDGETDYIRVTDKKIDETSHVLVMQIDVNEGETQDVAVIEIQKSGDKEAYIQIVGDKDLYGNDYVVEPSAEAAEAGFVAATTLAVNVWSWPAVAYVYSPSYVVWASPYRYEYYPVWWEPWPVVVYDAYYPKVSVYHTHYALSDGYRFVNIHEKYHSNYRTHTTFRYSEKNYGNTTVKIDEGKGDGRNNDKGKPDGDRNRSNGKGNDNSGSSDQSGKKDNNGSSDKNNKSADPKGGLQKNGDEKKNNEYSKPDHSKGGGGKDDIKSPKPSQPKPQGGKPNSGGSPKGGKGGGGKHK